MENKKIKDLELILNRGQKKVDYDNKKIDDLTRKIRKLERESLWNSSDDLGRFIISCILFFIGLLLLLGGKDPLIFSLCLIVFFGGLSSYMYISEHKRGKYIKTLEGEHNNLKNNVDNQVVLIEKTKKELSQSKGNKLESLILDFSNELDKDGNDTIDVIQHDNEFMKILKSNQKEILEMEKSENRDFTKQFVKLSNFLIEKERNLQGFFKRISDITELEQFDTFKTNLVEQIQFYNVLRLNSLQMISSFVENDRITFYVIYEKFDKLGVWNTNFENQFLSKMDLLNSNINSLISEISDMSYTINNSINELISITEENTSTLSDKLGQIGSKIDVSNMLSTINTYQNYKTNKKLK